MKATLTLLLSFGLAFAAGWWGIRERAAPQEGPSAAAISSRAAGQRPRDQPLTADALVAKHSATKPGALKKVQAESDEWMKTQEEQERKFETLKDSFVLEADPARQYQAAVERCQKGPRQWAEVQLISLAWLRQDADGFLAFLAKAKGDSFVPGPYQAVKERCQELSIAQNIELLGKLEAASQSSGVQALFSYLVSSTLGSGRLGDAIALVEQLPARQKDSFFMRLAIECPEKLRPEAFKWFADHAQSGCIRQMTYHIGEGKPGGMDYSWFGAMAERYPETREMLVNSGIYQQFMMDTWTKLPVEQGLAAMIAAMPGPLSDGEKRSQAMERLCSQAAGSALGAAWSPADGPLTIEQIVDQMSPRARELFAAAPDEMLKAVFPNLAMYDPEAAVMLTEGLDPKAREQLLLKAANAPTLRRSGDAERLLNLFTALPPSQEQGPLQARFMTWANISDSAYAKYGDSYPTWLVALPNSVDRDMALSGLAMVTKGSDPELSARLLAAKSQAPPTQ